MIRTIVTDIEGTTSSISFVKDVLFPYAAKHMLSFLQQHWDNSTVVEQVGALASDMGTTITSPEQANDILQQWICEDRKATPLKALQGMIWKVGYEQGDYRAHVYPDAAATLEQWHAQGLTLYVYSSGSIAAQKLFFGFSEAGDLTPLFTDYFDTTTGAKQDADSYRKIIRTINQPAGAILFLSDIVAELDAAATAGMQTCLLDRDSLAPACNHTRVRSFDEIALEAF